MTDNEIIKVLMTFAGNGFSPCSVSLSELARQTLSLIHRQQAEIEALITGQETLQKYRDDEITSLMNANVTLGLEVSLKEKKIEELSEVLSDTIRIRYAEARAEAIKEFAERLKENKIDIDVSFGYGREVYTEAVAVIEIDNLVEEMAGENNAPCN